MLTTAFITFATLGWFYYAILRRQAIDYGGAIVGFNAREFAAAITFAFAVLMSCIAGIMLFTGLLPSIPIV